MEMRLPGFFQMIGVAQKQSAAGHTVEHEVPEGCAMLLGIGRHRRQRPHVLLQLLRQHDVAEVALYLV